MELGIRGSVGWMFMEVWGGAKWGFLGVRWAFVGWGWVSFGCRRNGLKGGGWAHT